MLTGVFLAVVGVESLLDFDGVIGFGGSTAEFDVPAAPFAKPAYPRWGSDKDKATFMFPLQFDGPPCEDRVPTHRPARPSDKIGKLNIVI